MMTDEQVAALKPGDTVKRDPAGYGCRVLAVESPRRVRIKDIHVAAVFWVKSSTLKARWHV